MVVERRGAATAATRRPLVVHAFSSQRTRILSQTSTTVNSSKYCCWSLSSNPCFALPLGLDELMSSRMSFHRHGHHPDDPRSSPSNLVEKTNGRGHHASSLSDTPVADLSPPTTRSAILASSTSRSLLAG
ncbi:hypothetical protein SCHPADRAFT_525999 [Schizopora paradoxa]|uniref:Uncharacterized protein n=1 Tax=Schizopora paradoxa TaxID=27342 RepID=A0A0H2RLG9_9AGAM|nr:hypothetical protein SCHPADRAFT_525999 [Schizopora paradoxa]